jgi:hypothetical protein
LLLFLAKNMIAGEVIPLFQLTLGHFHPYIAKLSFDFPISTLILKLLPFGFFSVFGRNLRQLFPGFIHQPVKIARRGGGARRRRGDI